MEIKVFITIYDEFLKLFVHFGAATKLAFSGKLLFRSDQVFIPQT